jgi:hypothetical protein
MDRDWDVPNKQNAWKKERLNAEKAEELREKGFSGMTKHAITRHGEHREARKKAAVTNNSAEAEATINSADYDAAIADEAIDKLKVRWKLWPLSRPSMATKEAEDAEVKKKRNWRTPKSCCC